MIRYSRIVDWNSPTDLDIGCMERLLKQLSRRALSIDRELLFDVLGNARLFVAEDEDLPVGESIVGMGTLVIMNLLTGRSAHIDDVVVHEKYRGQGIGRKITEHMITEARRLSAIRIDLTSKPERVAANQLYQSLGFKQRETNVYRLELTA